MVNQRIYLSPPHLDGHERELLLQAFDSNWITTLGPQVDAFEEEICAMSGIEHAAALSSGTAALHLALLMLGIGPGDEVICSDLTFAASANSIVYVGASPVFLDSDLATWNIDPVLFDEELWHCEKKGRLPKAAIIVDLYGQCADYERILACPLSRTPQRRWELLIRERQRGSLGSWGSSPSMAIKSLPHREEGC